MPTYSYACTECDNRFDEVQAFNDDALTTCPKCTGRLRKLFGNVGVVFKGSGFYRTDSRESCQEHRECVELVQRVRRAARSRPARHRRLVVAEVKSSEKSSSSSSSDSSSSSSSSAPAAAASS